MIQLLQLYYFADSSGMFGMCLSFSFCGKLSDSSAVTGHIAMGEKKESRKREYL